MRGAVAPGSLFAAASTRPALRLRRLTYLAASALLQAGAVVLAVTWLQASGSARRQERVEPVVAVRLLRPQLRAPSPPPAPGRPAMRTQNPATVPRTARMIQPREVPAELPIDTGIQEPMPQAPDGEAGSSVAGPGGRPGGVIGGAPEATEGPALRQAPPTPIAARTHDLASVRAGIARTLVYPPNARRNGLQGKVILEFVLLAEGRIRDLVLRTSSGFPTLDAAALAAVEAAAPFPPPGVDVLVVVPVVFRAE
jgi:periplasmic protein TonB